MKAVIKMDPATKCGILQVIPEDSTEEYALWNWFRRFDQSGGGDSILTIQGLENAGNQGQTPQGETHE